MNLVDPLQPFLDSQGVAILDGALATELENRGADLDGALWSARLLLEDPDAIRTLHLDYFTAGADIAISATYQASFQGFARRGLSRAQSAALMQLSVRLAQEARDQFMQTLPQTRRQADRIRPLVAASVGCYGAYLADGSEYRGDYGVSSKALRDWHRPRLDALLEAEPDLLACETIPCLQEAEVLVELLNEYRDAPAWLSFSCRDQSSVCSGERFAACVELAAASSAVVAVGLNCTAPGFAEPLLRSARRKTPKPLVCYPNSGERWDSASRQWIDGVGRDRLTPYAAAWKAAGARLIGGCCRTTPSDIRALRQRLLPGRGKEASRL